LVYIGSKKSLSPDSCDILLKEGSKEVACRWQVRCELCVVDLS
jgi:hypothetical protein